MLSASLRSIARRWRAVAAGAVVVGAVAAVALAGRGGDSGGDPGEVSSERRGPADMPPPTLEGGVELAPVDPASPLVGTDLAFGSPLPSEEAAAQGFLETPEVRAVLARSVHHAPDARRLGEVVVLSLDGDELFDEAVLDGFQRGVVAALAGAEAGRAQLAGRGILRATGDAGSVVAFREGDALVVVRAEHPQDAELIATRQLEGLARGEVGSVEPRTPIVTTQASVAFVAEPTIAFTPFAGPAEEQPPEPPVMPGATAVEGRFGVVAGERRTVVWSIAVDPALHPTAEALQPAMEALAAGRAGGAPVEPVEHGGRVVLQAHASPGERSAHVFRHRGLVLLVEGQDPAQLEAVTTAWIAALGP